MALRKRLGDDPKEVGKMLLAAQQRIRSGEYKRAQPKDQSPEAQAAWREEQGIPSDPKDYGYVLPEGVTIEQVDASGKERLDFFNGKFHEMNVPKSVAEGILKAYNERVAGEAEAMTAADAQLADATSDALIADWGQGFRPNLKMNAAFLDKELGNELTDQFMEARLPDGRKLMNMPEFAKLINKMARGEGGDIIDPGYGGVPGGSVDGRIAEIQKIMNTDFGRYRREGLDAELTKLLETQERRGKLTNPVPNA